MREKMKKGKGKEEEKEEKIKWKDNKKRDDETSLTCNSGRWTRSWWARAPPASSGSTLERKKSTIRTKLNYKDDIWGQNCHCKRWSKNILCQNISKRLNHVLTNVSRFKCIQSIYIHPCIWAIVTNAEHIHPCTSVIVINAEYIYPCTLVIVINAEYIYPCTLVIVTNTEYIHHCKLILWQMRSIYTPEPRLSWPMRNI